MGAPGVVEGVVYDSAGKGKAKVELSFEDGPGAGAKQVAKVSTDAEGHFRATCVPGQMCYVRRADADGAIGMVRRAVLPRETAVVQMDMGCAGRTVRGVILADGAAYTNGRVVLSDAYGAEMSVFGSVGKTDGEGRFAIEAPVDGRYGVYYESPTGKGQWVRAAMVEMAGRGAADVGVASQAAGAIHVSVAAEDPNDMDAGMKVVLHEGHGFWGAQVGEGKRAAGEDGYVIEGVRPGEYTVVVGGGGGLQYRQEIEYDAGTMGDIEIAVDATRDRGVAGGRYVNGTGQTLVLTDEMQRVVYYFGKEGRGQFKVSGLAKGSYSVCANFHGEALVLAEFGVGEGTDETVSVDTSQWTEAGRTAVCVQVVGEGSMIVGADAQMTSGYEMMGPAAVTADGSWFIVDAGSHRVSAGWPGYREATVDMEAAVGDVWGKAGKANTVIIDLGDREGN